MSAAVPAPAPLGIGDPPLVPASDDPPTRVIQTLPPQVTDPAALDGEPLEDPLAPATTRGRPASAASATDLDTPLAPLESGVEPPDSIRQTPPDPDNPSPLPPMSTGPSLYDTCSETGFTLQQGTQCGEVARRTADKYLGAIVAGESRIRAWQMVQRHLLTRTSSLQASSWCWYF